MPSPNQTQQTIFDFLSVAEHSESAASRVTALQTLSSLTKVSSHNRTLLSQIPTAIPSIAVLAASQSAPISSLALSVLFNLSLNPVLKNPLALLPSLLLHLNSLLLPPHSSKLAASLLCSLAMLDKNKAALGISGTVQTIVRSVSEDNVYHIMHYLLSSLSELVKFRGNCTLAVRAGAVPALIRLMQEEEEFAGSASGTLAMVVKSEEGIAAVRGEEGVVEVMVEGMRNGCMATKENAAEVLVRMFEDSEDCVREAVGTEEFVAVLADVAVRGSANAREKAGVLMRIVMEADLDCYVEENP